MFKSIMNSLSSAWGSKESKVITLTYEEARNRLTDGEFLRLSDAFSRVATHNSVITKQVFSHEVLGELFPSRIAECIYAACGGTARGLGFRDLIAALALLTKGTNEEKIRFIFSMYSQDNTVITKDDLIRFTEEIEGIILPDAVINKLFLYNSHIEYDQFNVWLSDNPTVTSISAWILGRNTRSSSGAFETSIFKLTDDHDTPTFFQTLAGVTHLEEQDIIELEKRYWVLHETSRTGKMDLSTMLPLVSPPLPPSIVQGFMDAFDENRDGHIDFKEMACGISAAARGPALERQKFCFKIFDKDRDGVLSRPEISHMVTVMKMVMLENLADSPSEEVIAILTRDEALIVEEILGRVRGPAMTVVEYLEWSLTSQLPEQFLALIYQVCQIVLGLRPLNPTEEFEVITAWISREEKRGYQTGQVWYLVAMDWWNNWLNYVNPSPIYMSNSDSGVGSIIGSIGSQSNSVSSFSDSNGNGINGSGTREKSSSSRCWSMKKSTVESSVAMDLSQNVMVTGVSQFEVDGGTRTSSPTALTPNGKSSASSLSLVTMDSSSRSTCSSSPSPINSPGTFRRQLTSGSLNGKSMKRRRPEAIDNSSLIAPTSLLIQKIPSLTSEGGRIRGDVEEGRDFKVIPAAVWTALLQWYGSSVELARKAAARRLEAIDRANIFSEVTTFMKRLGEILLDTGEVLMNKNRRDEFLMDMSYMVAGKVNHRKAYNAGAGDVPDYDKLERRLNRLSGTVVQIEKRLQLELHPLTLLLYRHQLPAALSKQNSSGGNVPWTGMAGMYGGAALNTTISYVQQHHLNPPKRILSYTASFSRQTELGDVWRFICKKLGLSMQDTRLDLLVNDLSFTVVLEEENQTLEELGVREMSHILVEVRNKDQTWPEEIGNLANIPLDISRLKRNMTVDKGLTGLNNLGNTCFMNSAIQCVSNTIPLTQYFRKRMHMFELNRVNPIGMKGHIAKRYGDLITDIWSGTAKTIAPFKLRWTIGKYAPRFSGFQQNDAQEFLAFLLDGLHEDLNRVAEKPYVELKDSNNRPDIVCAQEAWENHLLRNKSIVVDLFHGQLKSSVRCKECNQESVRFDPFNYLSLPLPMECYVFCDLVVIRQNGSVPVRYGVLANAQDHVYDVKVHLYELTESKSSPPIQPENFIFVQIQSFRISNILSDNDKVKLAFNGRPVYAFEITLPRPDSALGTDSEPTDQQIQRILTSSKNSSPSGSLRPPVQNGTPAHSRQSSYSGSFSGSMITASSLTGLDHASQDNLIFVVHRKMIRQDSYFIASQKSRPVLFGLPLLVPYHEQMTHLDLYKKVWALVARLVSPLPPTDGPISYNHAQDCDDSLGYEYPFKLRVVMREAEWCCGRCPWHNFCRGCHINCSEKERVEKLHPDRYAVAIDWDPTALHLRYQTTHEFEHTEDPSIGDAHRRQSESVALRTCLANFTKDEELSEEEKYYCSNCEAHQLASKKLQIWRLPPVLIVHLKRFQFVGARWIKSHKVVEFPVYDLNPSDFLADVPKRTVELAHKKEIGSGDALDGNLFPLQDFHQHRLLSTADPFDLNYRLYAIVCHSGIMGGGHYISYARNPEGKWFCYNDSSCKEVSEDQIDKSSAYMLFYERTELDSMAYMPRIDPKAIPIVTDDEMEAEENDLKKQCLLH